MENEERKKLVVKLYDKMRFAKSQAKSKEDKDNNSLFVKPVGYSLNPKYISHKQYFQIAQFYNFLKENPELTNEDIKGILNTNNKFSFLRKLDKSMPDFLEELKMHGPMCIATTYASRKHKDEQLKKLLP